MVAGIEDYGTQAAGEFITDPTYVNAAFRDAPRDWHKRNIQLVLHTRIIEETPGPANVVARQIWQGRRRRAPPSEVRGAPPPLQRFPVRKSVTVPLHGADHPALPS